MTSRPSEPRYSLPREPATVQRRLPVRLRSLRTLPPPLPGGLPLVPALGRRPDHDRGAELRRQGVRQLVRRLRRPRLGRRRAGSCSGYLAANSPAVTGPDAPLIGSRRRHGAVPRSAVRSPGRRARRELVRPVRSTLRLRPRGPDPSAAERLPARPQLHIARPSRIGEHRRRQHDRRSGSGGSGTPGRPTTPTRRRPASTRRPTSRSGPPLSVAPIYPSYPPPYPMPLRGIQIQIRVVDPRNAEDQGPDDPPGLQRQALT